MIHILIGIGMAILIAICSPTVSSPVGVIFAGILFAILSWMISESGGGRRG